MEKASRFEKAELLIVENKNFLYSTVSYLMVLIIFLNLSFVNSPFLGTIASISFFLINGIFLGYALFHQNALFLRIMLGNLLLTLLIGTAAWFMTLTNNLDNIKTMVALLAVTTLCSILNVLKKKQIRNNDASITSSYVEEKADPPEVEVSSSKKLRLFTIRIVYLGMVILSFYLLFLSRRDEVHTVWEFMHPLFMPVFFATTFILLIMIFSEEKVSHKLLLITIHSILSHTFFVILFPASGDVGGQQTVLGTARLLYGNTVVQDPAWSYYPNLLVKFSYWFMEGFQISFSVVFARMFSVDLLWSHVLFIPIAWSVFVPLSVFMVTKMLSQRENVSVLASLLFSAFPSSIIWGTISVPNSLGFITFFWTLYFALKYLSTQKDNAILFALVFSASSFASHFLTGIMAFLVILLAVAYRRFEEEKDRALWRASALFLSPFAFCVSLLPLVLPFVRFFTRMRPYFGLDKLNSMSLVEKFQYILFGEYVNFSIGPIIIYGTGLLIGLIAMLYYLKKNAKSRERTSKGLIMFLLLCFLIFFVDYRVLKAFMVNPPFNEERLWLFSDFIAVSFLAMAIENVTGFILKIKLPFFKMPSFKVKWMVISVYTILFVMISGWVTASVYYAYPHYGPLQTTSYEIKAVKLIDEYTPSSYIVISDQWFAFAGEIFFGVYNPRAFYFSHWDSRGVRLFIDVKTNPSSSVMNEAFRYNNATRVYFVIEKPRLGEEMFTQTVSLARENDLATFLVLYDKGEEKIRVFYYEKS